MNDKPPNDMPRSEREVEVELAARPNPGSEPRPDSRPNLKPNPRPNPSPQWFGAVILGCLTLATVWILTYTLAPLPGQHALGGWNYAIVGVLLSLFIGLSMVWRGDPLDRRRQEVRAAMAGRRGRAGGGDGSAAGSAG